MARRSIRPSKRFQSLASRRPIDHGGFNQLRHETLVHFSPDYSAKGYVLCEKKIPKLLEIFAAEIVTILLMFHMLEQSNLQKSKVHPHLMCLEIAVYDTK